VGVAEQATDKAWETAQRQKRYAADQIGKLAGALVRVGKELQREDPGAVDGYAAQLGAEDFDRRRPPAFLSLAAGAGLAASRLLVSSSPQSSVSEARVHPVRAARRAII
jgi:hypothetical protein